MRLFRFPVKSMLGQQVPHIDIDPRGCVGDRLWSVRTETGKIGSGKSTRRFATVPGLLNLRAERHGDSVTIAFPDGTTCAIDAPDAAAQISRHVGQQVRLAVETAVSHYDDGPVSLLGSASVEAVARHRRQAVEPVRFRPNIVLQTASPFVEETWIGRRLAVGTAVLEVTMASPRCVMVDAGTADLPPQPGNLVAIGDLNSARLGVVAHVLAPGRVRDGDHVVVLA